MLKTVAFIRFLFSVGYVTFPYEEILSFFGHCHVTSPYKVFLSLFDHYQVTSPTLEPLSFSGRIVQKVVVGCFSDFSEQVTTQQSDAAVMLQMIPTFNANCSKNKPFLSANTYEKYVVCNYYCVACHDAEVCFLPVFGLHILILGNNEELLENLDTLCFTYQHVSIQHIVFKYRFSGNIVVNSGQVFDNEQRAVFFYQRSRGVDRMSSLTNMRLF